MRGPITEPAGRFELRQGAGESATVALSGRLDIRSTGRIWDELERALRQKPPAALEVDASGVEHCDGAGLALLHYLGMGGMSPSGVRATVRGLRPEFINLFRRFSAEDYQKNLPQPPPG